jgi:hypothetical protein
MDIKRTSKIIPGIVSVFGVLNRTLVRLPGIGKKIVAGSSRSVGRVIPRLNRFGFIKEPSYENAVWNWDLFLDLIGADYEKEEAGDNATIYKIYKCPAGFCQPEHVDACEATMECDHSLVDTSGARLVVEKRFPNDGICVEKVIAID